MADTQPALAAGQVWVPAGGKTKPRRIGALWLAFDESGVTFFHESDFGREPRRQHRSLDEFRAWIAKHDAKLEGG